MNTSTCHQSPMNVTSPNKKGIPKRIIRKATSNDNSIAGRLNPKTVFRKYRIPFLSGYFCQRIKTAIAGAQAAIM